MSLFLTVLITAYNAFTSVVTKVYEEEGEYALGPFTMLTIYCGFMLGGFFIPQLNKVSEKWVFVLGAIGHLIGILSGIQVREIPDWKTYLITGCLAIFCGMGNILVWSSAGAYIHKTAHLYNRMHLKGHYFGILNFMANMSMVSGGLIVTLLLPEIEHTAYYILVALIAGLASLFALLFVKDVNL